MHRRFQKVQLATAFTSMSRVVFSSQPFTVLVNNNWVWRITVMALLALHVYTWAVLYGMVRLGLPSFKHYKLTALERRSGQMPLDLAQGPGVLRFGLIGGSQTVDRCVGTLEPKLNVTSEGEMLMSFQLGGEMVKRSEAWDGWYLITALENGSQAQDPVGSLPPCLPAFLSPSIH
jgi:hypothetical protein